MTTRTELLDAFEAKLAAEGSFLMPAPGDAMPDGRSWIHATYESLDGEHVVEWHKCQYWDNVTDNVERESFYVKDRGEAGEEATWFKGNDPKPPEPEPTVRQQFETWLQSKVSDGTIEHFSNVSANEVTERGTCTVVLDQSGTIVEKRVIVEKGAGGTPQYKVIQE